MPRIGHAITISFSSPSPRLRVGWRARLSLTGFGWRARLSLTGLVAALALAAPAAASAYTNPFGGDTPIVGRTDMGVDVCLTQGDPIRAIGSGTVVGIMRNWYAGQPYLWYQLSGGPAAGQYVYVSEQIDHLARIGQSLQAGDVIARYARSGSCIETGWSMADGETQAQATTGYKDGQVTTAGVSFVRFLLGLGVTGQFELSAPQTQTNPATTTQRRRKHRSPSTPKPVSTHGSGPSPGPNFGPGTEPYWPATH